MTDDSFVTAIFEPSATYRLVEERGPGSFTVLEDGRLLAKWGFADLDGAVLWFLGFGDQVEVVDPPEMAERMRTAAERIMRKYGG